MAYSQETETHVTYDEISKEIEAVLTETLQQADPNAATLKFSDDTELLQTGIDSLGFAIVVTTLEETLGFDPFTLSEEAFYPQTFGDSLNSTMITSRNDPRGRNR